MNVSAESGFTLTEMLVALLVLGVTASAMSTSMGTAFKSYERLSDVSDNMQADRQLQSIFTDISNSYWLPNGSTKELTLSSLDVPNPHFQKLEIIEVDGNWELLATAQGFEPVRVYQSEIPLRLIAYGVKPPFNAGRKARFDYQILSLQVRDGEWVDMLSVPLKVDADPECRFDIVGRRCR